LLGPEGLVILVAVVLLAGFHVAQWADQRRPATTGDRPTVGQTIRGLSGGGDPWTRALVLGAIVALCFAFAAPLVAAIT
jgi:hypothetical protein